MAVVQVNPPGMASTDPGYISSITVRTGGAATVDAPAATAMVQQYAGFKLITG